MLLASKCLRFPRPVYVFPATSARLSRRDTSLVSDSFQERCKLPLKLTVNRSSKSNRLFQTSRMENSAIIANSSDVMAQINSEKKRGAFIVFEGIDRCGKTSQTKTLVEYLNNQGIEAELWNFPDRTTEIGKMINAYLKNSADLDDHVIHLLFSANRWEKSKMMEEKLRSGVTLIMDRYAFSGQAFSAAKGMDLEWCKAPDRGLLAPDAVIHLHIEVAEAARRGGFGEERYETLAMQTKVAENFATLGKELQRDGHRWITVNAAQSQEEVRAEVTERALEIINSISLESKLGYFQ